MPKKGYKQTKDHISKRTGLKNTKDKIRNKMIGNKNSFGYKFSDIQSKYLSERMMGNKNALGHKVSDLQMEKIIKNGFGVKCYSDDGLFFPSIEERGCYYWLRDDVDEVIGIEHPFKGRFDLLLILNTGEEVVLEYHPIYNCLLDRRTLEEYYVDRRRLLNEMGFKNLKLVVMTSLRKEEKERVSNLIKTIKEKKCLKVYSHS